MWNAVFKSTGSTHEIVRFKGVAATTRVDRQGDRIALKALETMSHARDIWVSSGHWNSRQRQIGQITECWIEDKALHVRGILNANLPAVKRIEQALQKGEKLGLSVGGKIQRSHHEVFGNTLKIRVIDEARIEHVAICRDDEAINPATYLQLDTADEITNTDEVERVTNDVIDEEGAASVRLLQQLAERLMNLLKGLQRINPPEKAEAKDQADEIGTLTLLTSEIHDMQEQIRTATDLLGEIARAQIELAQTKAQAVQEFDGVASDAIEKSTASTSQTTPATPVLKEKINRDASRQSLDGQYTSKCQKAPSWRGVV